MALRFSHLCRNSVSSLSKLSGKTSALPANVNRAKGHQANLARNMSSEKYSFETLSVTEPSKYVYQVEMNRPTKLNAMNMEFWSEMRTCFSEIAGDPNCRVVVLSGSGRVFTAGLDLKAAGDMLLSHQETEVGRRGFLLRSLIPPMQESFTVIEKCPKPVIAAVHNACVGGGIDMISACDIRLCSQDAFFVIKEVDLGLAADVGTLQRFPKVIGNDSLARELVYTARDFRSDEAMQIGFVSRVFSDKKTLLAGALDLANSISKKSPVAIQGSKVNLVYARDHSVQESLDFQVAWNSLMLQSEDLPKAVMAGMQKEAPEFSKL
ncbi:delta(3,5)-Delta(2,4)-dienoyl-CoA isomerase, mitochondrial-like isoform X2 [Apostichopus japonicus]|uniref:delta(3,5)-Delta(2,4)-dienoyl-CoA isomerase, mitochondrial-like isoform X2 n=1 Tax=Stichopus japonicus TaxID=307972 RepID=UPI003AB6EE81